MKITLLSDTHSYLDEHIMQHCDEADEVWHAGDFGTMEVLKALEYKKKFRGVFGNIDGNDIRRAVPRELRFTVEGLDVYMIHIGGYPPRYEKHTINMMRTLPPHLYICGHSHILKIMRDPMNKSILHINPGAAGNHGFHKVRTLVKFEVLQGALQNVEVVELGPRFIEK